MQREGWAGLTLDTSRQLGTAMSEPRVGIEDEASSGLAPSISLSRARSVAASRCPRQRSPCARGDADASTLVATTVRSLRLSRERLLVVRAAPPGARGSCEGREEPVRHKQSSREGVEDLAAVHSADYERLAPQIKSRRCVTERGAATERSAPTAPIRGLPRTARTTST